MNKLIIIGVCLILALVLGFTLTWPKYQNLRVLQINIEAKEAEFQSKEEYFSRVKEVSEELEKYPESFSKISSALPENPSLPSLFNFLQLSAAQTGLVLEEIILGGVAEGEIKASCQLTGDYSAFKSFLLILENSARIIEIEKISFAFPEEAEESFDFIVRIKTNFY